MAGSRYEANQEKLLSELRAIRKRMDDSVTFAGDLYEGLSIMNKSIARHHFVRRLLRDCPEDSETQDLSEQIIDMLEFPAMLVDDERCVRDPFDQVLERGQRRIDAALEELADEQRAYYLDATSFMELEWDASLMRPGFCIVLRQGKLLLEDEASLDDKIRCFWGGKHKGAFPCPGTLKDYEEFHQYRLCVPEHVLCQQGSEELVWSVWDELAPLLHDGRIDWDDLEATVGTTWAMDHRDRVNECLSYHRLVHEEGWREDRTKELIGFAISLHQAAGDDGFDLAEDLLSWGDIAAMLLDRHWGLCEYVTKQAWVVSCESYPQERIPESLYEKGVRIEWIIKGCWLRGTVEERALAAIVMDMLAALNRHDAPAALNALQAFCTKREEFNGRQTAQE